MVKGKAYDETKSAALPGRAENALVRKCAGKGFRPFSIARVALLYSVGSPLVSEAERLGPGLGWLITAEIMRAEDTDELSALYADKGLGALTKLCVERVGDLPHTRLAEDAVTLREAWAALIELDPASRDDSAEDTPAGKA